MLFAEEVRRGEEVTRYRWNQKKKALVFEIATVEGVVATFSFRTARLNQSHRDFRARSTHFSIIVILSSQRTYALHTYCSSEAPADHFLCYFQRQHADFKEQLTSLAWRDIVRGCPTFIGPFFIYGIKERRTQRYIMWGMQVCLLWCYVHVEVSEETPGPSGFLVFIFCYLIDHNGHVSYLILFSSYMMNMRPFDLCVICFAKLTKNVHRVNNLRNIVFEG